MWYYFYMSTPEISSPLLPDFGHIGAYEEWAMKYWIHPPGSLEAQLHARAKLDEETDELIQAILNGNPEDVISEDGDVLWSAAASASNAGITITEVLTSAFPGYFDPKDPIDIKTVDELALMLFDDISIKDVQDYLTNDARALGKAAKQWFVLGKTVNTPRATFADALISLKRIDAADALLNLTLLTSYVAQRYGQKGLKSVLEANYKKIEQRVQTGSAVTKQPRRMVTPR